MLKIGGFEKLPPLVLCRWPRPKPELFTNGKHPALSVDFGPGGPYKVTIEHVETAQENVNFKVPRVLREAAL